MTDIEQAVAAPTSKTNGNDPRCRRSLHDEIRREGVNTTDDTRASRSLLGDDPSPKSRGLGLPIGMPSSTGKPTVADIDDGKLLHPALHNIPMQFRFGCNGILSNVLFMIVYNMTVEYFDTTAASRIYLILYFIFIPISHAMTAVFVFGWPERYLSSLLSNLPIGLTAMAIGGALTAYLDRIEFNESIEEWIRDNFTFSHMPPRNADEKSEFYSSIVVLVVTSIWTYVLSVYINSPKASDEKKEL